MPRPSALALACLLLAGPVAAAEAQQFNLICNGFVSATVDSREPRLTDAPRQRWSKSFRVDLGSKRYCADACAKVEALVEGEPGQVVFTDIVALPDLSTRERHSAVYDPKSRRYRGSDSLQDLNFGFYKSSSQTVGSCEAGPFSGFP